MPSESKQGTTEGNRAERRRRGLTRSRLAKSGRLASAGVLLSAGLFGAYTGNPRLQRAYATAPCTGEVVGNEAQLLQALDDSTVTCIEIQGSIGLTAPLPRLVDDSWVTYREASGLTIFGTGDDTIDGNTQSGFDLALYNDDTVYLNISDLTLTDFQRAGGSALALATFNAPYATEVTLDGVTITNTASSGWGGAVYLYGERHLDVTVTDSRFANNTSPNNGGALYLYGASDITAAVERSDFENNDATGYGGAINVYTTSLSVETRLDVCGSTFTNNDASSKAGGAIHSQRGAVYVSNGADCGSIRNSTFRGNISLLSGGAIYAQSVSVTGGTIFDTNSSGKYGGAVGATERLDIHSDAHGSATFTDNTAVYGGAVYAYQGASYSAISGAVFIGNTATKSGGAIYTASPVTTEITNSTFDSNEADLMGGAISVWVSAGPLSIASSSFTANIAGDDTIGSGGAVRVFGPSVEVTNSFFGGNSSPGVGALHADDSATLHFSTLYDDTSTNGAAAEIRAARLTSIGTVVGSSTTGYVMNYTASLDDSYSVSTSDDTQFGGLGSGNVPTGGLELGSISGTAPGAPGRTPQASSVLALPSGGGGFAALTTNPIPGVTLDQIGATRGSPFTIGARQFTAAPGPAPDPQPVTPASSPRDVTATPGVRSAAVGWEPPETSGSFPVSRYQAIATPGGNSCLVPAGALTCIITGLTPGTPYRVTVRALNGAGWSTFSAPSDPVTPLAPTPQAIVISGTRDSADPRVVKVNGTSTGLIGAVVTPFVKLSGQTSYSEGRGTRTVDSQGRFDWQRKTGKKTYVFFMSDDVASNRVIIAAR
jgi:predicted outer membrane repeat protein